MMLAGTHQFLIFGERRNSHQDFVAGRPAFGGINSDQQLQKDYLFKCCQATNNQIEYYWEQGRSDQQECGL
jgi:hypothetical protein